jgi:hypothetical protein
MCGPHFNIVQSGRYVSDATCSGFNSYSDSFLRACAKGNFRWCICICFCATKNDTHADCGDCGDCYYGRAEVQRLVAAAAAAIPFLLFFHCSRRNCRNNFFRRPTNIENPHEANQVWAREGKESISRSINWRPSVRLRLVDRRRRRQ